MRTDYQRQLDTYRRWIEDLQGQVRENRKPRPALRVIARNGSPL
jgi:hypothetical protein